LNTTEEWNATVEGVESIDWRQSVMRNESAEFAETALNISSGPIRTEALPGESANFTDSGRRRESALLGVSAALNESETEYVATPAIRESPALENKQSQLVVPLAIGGAVLLVLIAALIGLVLFIRSRPPRLAYANSPTGSDIDDVFDDEPEDSESSRILLAEQV
jgi:hypothetical protein